MQAANSNDTLGNINQVNDPSIPMTMGSPSSPYHYPPAAQTQCWSRLGPYSPPHTNKQSTVATGRDHRPAYNPRTMPSECHTKSEATTCLETSLLSKDPNTTTTGTASIAPGDSSCNTPNTNTRYTLLLRLPCEIRAIIYHLALHDGRDIDLLLTCRHILMDTSSIIYDRPISFASQAKLFAWIDRSSEHDLQRVRHLTIQLTDVDLTPLCDPTAIRHGGSSSSNNDTNNNSNTGSTTTTAPTAWDLYQRELIHLDAALAALPTLETLTIRPPDQHRSMFVRSMYTCFVARIPLRCPRLKLLTLYNNNNNNNNSSSSTSNSSRSHLLQNLPELKKLAKVVFEDLPASASAAAAATATGNSSSSSSKAAAAATAAAAAAQRGPVRVKLEREE